MKDTTKLQTDVIKANTRPSPKTRLDRCIDLYVAVNGKQPSEEQIARWRRELGWWVDLPAS